MEEFEKSNNEAHSKALDYLKMQKHDKAFIELIDSIQNNILKTARAEFNLAVLWAFKYGWHEKTKEIRGEKE